ncbi:MAG: DMT family transporter [Candidatus Latescibacteria bacterium]|nr:DMT family transporter [Candidatus Latescibacterota bacterium]
MTAQATENKRIHKRSYRGFLWLLLSFFCGTIFITSSKYVLGFLPLSDYLCWWYGAGLVYHSVYGLRSGNISLDSISNRHKSFILTYVILDITGTTAAFVALKMMDPSVVSFLNQSQIIFTLILGYIFLNEILIASECIAAGVIITGMILMTYNSGSAMLIGVTLMVYANFVGAINLIIVRKIGCVVGAFTFARMRSISLFAIFMVYNLIKTGSVTVPAPKLLIITFTGAFFGPFLNVISVYKALETIPAGKLALFRSIQPLFIMVASGIFLHTIPGIRESLGGMIIITGSIILAYFHMGHVLGWKDPLRTLR